MSLLCLLTSGSKQQGAGAFKATAHSGAPFRIELPIVVTNGQISDGSSTIVIPAGGTESAPVAVARLADTTGAVTVDIGHPSLPAVVVALGLFTREIRKPAFGSHDGCRRRHIRDIHCARFEPGDGG